MDWEDWRDMYKEGMKPWKEQMKIWSEQMKTWKEQMKDWGVQAKSNMAKGHLPPMPPMPHLPPIHPVSEVRSNVVASRIRDEELRVIDMLTEAGLFSTRSEAVAYLVSEGIKARKDALDKVSSALEEIRRIRREAEEYVTKLRGEIGLVEPEEVIVEEQKKMCPECNKDLAKLPEDIAICPYCGFKLRKGK